MTPRDPTWYSNHFDNPAELVDVFYPIAGLETCMGWTPLVYLMLDHCVAMQILALEAS